MRFWDSKDGTVSGLVNTGKGEAIIYMGIVGNDYICGWCTIYEYWSKFMMIDPKSIKKATIEFVKWDDYIQLYIGDKEMKDMTLVYEAPIPGSFPPETKGSCELNTSWETYPNIDVTKYFKDTKKYDVVSFKTRVSVGGCGEGYARIRIQYDTPEYVIIGDDKIEF